jgi:hypothetical protein
LDTLYRWFENNNSSIVPYDWALLLGEAVSWELLIFVAQENTAKRGKCTTARKLLSGLLLKANG